MPDASFTIEVPATVDPHVLEQAVTIDMAALAYRSFLRSFGIDFMRQIYKDIFDKGLGFLIVAKEREKVVGFVIGCHDSGKVMGLIYKRFAVYLRLMIVKIVWHPGVILRILQTLFYTRKERVQIDAELLAIAVDERYRDAGLGAQMVMRLNDEFLKRNIKQYKVTVHSEMEASNRFYVKLGLKLSNQFTMYGVLWNLYICDLIDGR